ncbi:hypothetical protein B0H14DRAFT_3685535 [Mycena olivaceomarginata]|nr:hypothetical protein B0H14DRAFT_3685535 [Mycena olivaceomarginata]
MSAHLAPLWISLGLVTSRFHLPCVLSRYTGGGSGQIGAAFMNEAKSVAVVTVLDRVTIFSLRILVLSGSIHASGRGNPDCTATPRLAEACATLSLRAIFLLSDETRSPHDPGPPIWSRIWPWIYFMQEHRGHDLTFSGGFLAFVGRIVSWPANVKTGMSGLRCSSPLFLQDELIEALRSYEFAAMLVVVMDSLLQVSVSRPETPGAFVAAVKLPGQALGICEHWTAFIDLADSRVALMRRVDASKSLKACDNIQICASTHSILETHHRQCGKIQKRSRCHRCSGCNSFYYCDQQCQSVDWDSGGHDYEHDIRSTYTQQITLMASDEPFFTFFDYTSATVRIAAIAHCKFRQGAQLEVAGDPGALRKSHGRMQLHLVRVVGGRDARIWVIPLRASSPRPHDALRRWEASVFLPTLLFLTLASYGQKISNNSVDNDQLGKEGIRLAAMR